MVRKRLADGIERRYYYHRLTGAALAGEPGSDEFNASLKRAMTPASAPSTPPLDIEWLIQRYMASPEWHGLADGTRQSRRSYFRRIARRFAGAALTWLDGPEMVSVFYEWRDELALARGAWTANHSLDALSALFHWAKKRRDMAHNWALDVERLPVKNRAEKIWTVDLWRTLIAAARPDERELLEFAMLTAARESDCARLRDADLDERGWLTWTPQKTARKTGVVVQLPSFALPPLAELLAARSRASEFLLCTSQGHPWTVSNIKLRMRELKRRAFPKLDPDRTFHDIRGTVASRLMDAGCTDAEAASVMGWAIGSGRSGERVAMTRSYVKRSQQLALNAYQKWYAADWGPSGNVVPIKVAAGMETANDNPWKPDPDDGGNPPPRWNGIPERG